MAKIYESGSGNLLPDAMEQANLSRRKFLRYGAVASALVIGVSACDRDDDDSNNDGINLGGGDTGILNYAYALEQLEAAFYTQVMLTPYSGMTAAETALLADIRDHEIAHREFFRAALGGDAIQALTPDFTSINFSSRTSVLGAAKTFEDLGVSAYNGAGKYIATPQYLLAAGKIVSVEARHAAYIRDLISNGSFADSTVVDAIGLDQSSEPLTVISAANGFLVTKITGKNLPTS